MPIDEVLLVQVSLKVTGADVHQFGVLSPDYKCSMQLAEDPEIEEDGPRGRRHWAAHAKQIEERLRKYLATGDGKWLRYEKSEDEHGKDL